MLMSVLNYMIGRNEPKQGLIGQKMFYTVKVVEDEGAFENQTVE